MCSIHDHSNMGTVIEFLQASFTSSNQGAAKAKNWIWSTWLLKSFQPLDIHRPNNEPRLYPTLYEKINSKWSTVLNGLKHKTTKLEKA